MSSQSNNFGIRPFARNFVVLWGALLLLARWSAFADQSVTLTWSPSPNTNVAGYKIYYGGASRVYTNTTTLGNITNVTLSGLSEGTTYYFGATTIDSAGVESGFSDEASYTVPQMVVTNLLPEANQPPTLEGIANLTIYQNAGLQTVDLTGIGSGSASESQMLTVSAVSSNPGIIPVPAVNYASPNSAGSLTFTPVANALGMATVTVTVDDGGSSNNITTRMFTVTVLPVPVANQPPTLDGIGNLTIYQNAGLQIVPLTSISSGSASENQTLTVSAVSSNPGIIPAPAVNYASPNTAGSLTFAPVTDALGTAMVTVTIDDGGASNNVITRTFAVTVVPSPSVKQPPTLDSIANVSLIQNAAAQTITLTGISSGSKTESQVLKVSATSNNPRLVPTPKISYTSPASTALLTFQPMADGTGMARITVTVKDGGKSNNIIRRTFTVAVQPNRPPTLDPISNVIVDQNGAAQTLTLTGITSGSPTENQTLRVTANSSNPRLLPAPLIQYASPANTAQLTFKPQPNLSGVATITVTVNDGGRNNNVIRQHFKVIVTAPVNANPLAQASQAVGAGAAAILSTVANTNGQFSFKLTGVSGGKYVVQATSDLVHWTAVKTNTAPFIFQDDPANGFRQRFYRAFYLP